MSRVQNDEKSGGYGLGPVNRTCSNNNRDFFLDGESGQQQMSRVLSTDEHVHARHINSREIVAHKWPDSEFQMVDYSSDSEMSETPRNANQDPASSSSTRPPRTSKFNQNILFVRMHEWTGVQSSAKLSNFEGMMTIIKYYLTIGVLTLPQMFYISGYLLGLLMLIGVTIISVYSIYLLLKVNEDIYAKDPKAIKQYAQFGDLVLKVLGPRWRLIQRNISAIASIGSCVAYLIFIQMYLSELLKNQWSHLLTLEQTHLIAGLCAFLLIFPLSTLNNVSMYFQTNFLGVFLGVLAICIMIYRDFTLILSTGIMQRNDHYLWKSENIGFSLGISVYCLKISGIALSVRSNMATPQSFMKIFNVSTVMTSALYLTFGIVTQLALGEYANNIALLNFAPHSLLGFVARLAYILSILLSYPLKFFLLIVLIENTPTFKESVFSLESYQAGLYKDSYEHQYSMLKRYGFRYLLTVIIFVTAMFSIQISSIISIIGSVLGIFNQFIVPQMIYLTHFKDTISRFEKYSGRLIVFFCIIGSGLGLFPTLERMK